MGIRTGSFRHFRLLPLALCLLLSASGCRKKESAATIEGSELPSLDVEVVEVKAQPLALTVPVTGSLVSRALVVVKAETAGRLLKFAKEEGDAVTAGEAVAWVDDENYRLAVRQDQTAVQVSEAALARTRVAAEHAASELERARNLLKSGGITDRDLKAAELTERDSRAQVALAEAQLAQTRAVLAGSEKRLRDTVIRSPISGVIEQRFVNPGAYVEAPTQMFSIVDNQRLELESPVPSTDLAQIRQAQRVSFAVNSYPGATFEGTVVEVNPAVDPLTRSARVRISVNNSGGRLRAGMFAQGAIQTGVEHNTVVVPAVAVYRSAGSGGEAYAFVVENGKAARRAVRIGRETGGRVQIREGLRPGDVLIAEQKIELAEGVSVSPRKSG